MPKIRIGFATDFNLVNEQVGIGTTNPTALLDVRGDILADNSAGSGGISTLTRYDGFLNKTQSLPNNVSIAQTTKGNLNSLSGEIVIDGEITVTEGTSLTGGRLDSLTVTGTFDIPHGGTLDREETPEKGSTRFNQDLGQLEFYTGLEWRTTASYDGSGRGRGVFGGGVDTSDNNLSVIEYVNISSLSNSYYFGDMTVARRNFSTASSETRGVFSGANSPSTNLLDYITIASQGNAIDFGQLSITGAGSGCSSSTRGIFAGGNSPGNTNTIEYITIHTLGNGLDFGDLIRSVDLLMAASSPTRAVIAGGRSPLFTSLINYITISSTGDAKNFGDLTTRKTFTEGCSSSTRGIFAGGQSISGYDGINTIEYLTFTTLGNSIYFGDLTKNRKSLGSTSTNIRGLFAGGYDPEFTNIIDYITISSTGDAQDFGDLSTLRRGAYACSDSHGGLGGF